MDWGLSKINILSELADKRRGAFRIERGPETDWKIWISVGPHRYICDDLTPKTIFNAVEYITMRIRIEEKW